MAYTKTIVCLANSIKVGGSCIAGRELLQSGSYGGWVRPVSSRPTAEISFMESLCHGNTDPQLLDVLDIPLSRPLPHNHQTENHLISEESWTREGRLAWQLLSEISETPSTLWINKDRTSHGTFDCLTQQEAGTCTNSLFLIHVRVLKVEVKIRNNYGVRKHTFRANFKYSGTYYSLKLTDPVAIANHSRMPDGEYPLPESYLCISLTEPYAKDNNRCHKLVAAIISNPSL